MKDLLWRRFLPAILCMALALGLSACGGKDTPPVETETDGAMGTLSGSKGGKDSGVGVFSGSGEETAEAELAEESLNLLYDAMAYDDQYAGAVAYLGYRKQGDSTPLSDWLVENCAGLVEAMPFLLHIPAERILGAGWGDLFCIVPRDENTSLAVNHVTWESLGNGVWPVPGEVLYREEYAQPVLVFVGYEEFRDEPDIEIIASDSGGAGGLVTWYPVWDVEVGGDMIVPTGEDYAPLVMDFTLFGDVTGLDYWGDPDGWEPTGVDWWVSPTEEGLADTCWVCDGWSLNLLGGDGDLDYAGIAELYCQSEDGQEYQLLYSGVWRMVDDCLQLIVSTGAGNLPSDASGVFPVLIDPSGDYLHIQQDRDNGMRPPFFDNDMSSMELIRSYG